MHDKTRPDLPMRTFKFAITRCGDMQDARNRLYYANSMSNELARVREAYWAIAKIVWEDNIPGYKTLPRTLQKTLREQDHIKALVKAARETFDLKGVVKAVSKGYENLLSEPTREAIVADARKKTKRFDGTGRLHHRFKTNTKQGLLLPVWGELTNNKHLTVTGCGKYRAVKIATFKKRAHAQYESFELCCHRAIPANANICGYTLVCRRVGPNLKWFLHLLAEHESFAKKATGHGVVAFDLGHRRLSDGSMLVATWLGDDGRWGEVILPQKMVEAHEQLERIQSDIDSLFNAAHSFAKNVCKDMPLTEQERKSLPHWKSPKKLRGIVLKWRDTGACGEAYETLHKWRRRHDHLWREKVGLLRHIGAVREHLYYNVAACLLNMGYGIAVLDTAQAKLEKKKAPKGEKLPDGERIKDQSMNRCKQLASWGKFNYAMKASGMETVAHIDPSKLSRMCSRCGHDNKPTKRKPADGLTCEKCGYKEDRDVRPCMNLLKLYLGKTVELVGKKNVQTTNFNSRQHTKNRRVALLDA